MFARFLGSDCVKVIVLKDIYEITIMAEEIIVIFIWVGIICFALVTGYIIMKSVEGLGRMAYQAF